MEGGTEAERRRLRNQRPTWLGAESKRREKQSRLGSGWAQATLSLTAR